MIHVTLRSFMNKLYSINMINMTKKGKKEMFKIKKKKEGFFSWDGLKKCVEGNGHTLFTVRFITYQNHSLLSNIPL